MLNIYRYTTIFSYISTLLIFKNIKLPPKGSLRLVIFALASIYLAIIVNHHNSPATVMLTVLQFSIVATLITAGWIYSDHLIFPARFGIYIHIALSIIFTLLFSNSVKILAHPFITSTSLGILIALSLLLANTSHRSTTIIIQLMLLGLLFWTESRTGVLFLISALLFRLYFYRPKLKYFNLIKLLIFASIVPLLIYQYIHIVKLDGSNRDQIWFSAIDALPKIPLFGVGAYSIGKNLTDLSSHCELWPSIRDLGVSCINIFENVQMYWLIAHNGFIQSVADSGIFGFAFTTLLLTAAVCGFVASSNVFSASILFGLVVSSNVDASTLIPSPGFGEIYWILIGQGLNRFSPVFNRNYLVWLIVLIILPSAILLPDTVNSIFTKEVSPRIFSLYFQDQISREENYRIIIAVRNTSRRYKAVLRYCDSNKNCRFAKTAYQNENGTIDINTIPPPDGTTTAHLALFPENAKIWEWVPKSQMQWSLKSSR